ncbi:MAG: SUMF1/EgtB/PvdO family nonheme iron enzyme [SAR324 cluster bacterium]|nr:SUMF1/EgtB/PvdO family nonheme iron enzyme [SAR324 cluster bacterium]
MAQPDEKKEGVGGARNSARRGGASPPRRKSRLYRILRALAVALYVAIACLVLALAAVLLSRAYAAEVPRAEHSEGVVIPAGEAPLGSDAAQKAFGYSLSGQAARKWGWYDHEPRRRVRLPAYWMDLTLVTQQAYGRFIRTTGHRRPYISRAAYQAQGFLVHPYEAVLPFLWFSDEPVAWLAEHPVTLVSVGDAQAYCAWRGRQERRICRLPSEDEWEYAARGAEGRRFPWGDGWEPRRLNSAERGPYTTTPVKRYPRGRSPHGLYDMAGNLFQWTASVQRPGRHILKGCSWDDDGGICRGAARHARKSGSRHILIGFRCACEAESPN